MSIFSGDAPLYVRLVVVTFAVIGLVLIFKRKNPNQGCK